MPRIRMTLGRSMVAVAVVAVLLAAVAGLDRRRQRFRAVAAEQLAAAQIGYFNTASEAQDMEAPAYHHSLAQKYRAAADRPWLPLVADPPEPEVVRAFRRAHEAVKRAYPGLDLAEYHLQVTTMQRGGAFPHVRYRHRNGKSGLNVHVRDPVEIHVHADGPPPSPRP